MKDKETNLPNMLAQWDSIKELVSLIEQDVIKNVAGTCSAGLRARRGLRELRSGALNLLRMSRAHDNARRAVRKAARAAKKTAQGK